jgi:hypothetical protein
VAQSPGLTEPKGLTSSTSTLVKLSRQEGYLMWQRQCYHKVWPPSQVEWSAGLTSGPPEPQLQPRHQLKPPINTLLLLSAESEILLPIELPSSFLVE